MRALTIGIEATPAGSQGAERHGVFRYLQQLLLGFRAIGGPHRFRLWFNSFRDLSHRRIDDFLAEVRGLDAEAVVSRFPARLRKGLNLPADWFTGPIDVFHGPSHLLPNVRRAPAVVTIHDLAFLHMSDADMNLKPEWVSTIKRRSSDPQAHLRAYRSRCAFFRGLRDEVPGTLARADAVLAVSEATARDLAMIAGVAREKIRVVPNGSTSGLASFNGGEGNRAALAAMGIDGGYVLYVGVLEPNKDLHTLFVAFSRTSASFRRDNQLVITGPLNWFQTILQEEAEHLGIAEAVRFTGYVSDRELAALYRGAALVVCPSPLEGFGFPVLEAMAFGVPAVIADAGALPEVAGEAALRFPARDATALARAMEQVTGSPSLAGGLRAKGLSRWQDFSWEQSAKMTLDLYAELAG